MYALKKPVYLSELEDNIQKLKVIDKEIKRLTKLYVSLKANVVDQMGNNTEAFDGSGHLIATLTMQSRESFDKGAFESQYPGVYNCFVKQTEFSVLRLK